MNNTRSEPDSWKLLHVFESKVRIEILKLLLEFEWRSLSDIAKKIEHDFDMKMTLPALLKHMKELERAGMVRHESGIFAERPDARKTMYLLQGKERVEKILQQLEQNVKTSLHAGVIFSETADLAREIQRMSTRMAGEERKRLESLLTQCESEKLYPYLTEDEKKKIKLWRMMLGVL